MTSQKGGESIQSTPASGGTAVAVCRLRFHRPSRAAAGLVVPVGAGYKLRLSESAEFADEGRVVLSLSDGADCRVENVAALTARLTGLFSLKVAHTVRYVNSPAPTFEKTDTITSVALVAKFARP